MIEKKINRNRCREAQKRVIITIKVIKSKFLTKCWYQWLVFMFFKLKYKIVKNIKCQFNILHLLLVATNTGGK